MTHASWYMVLSATHLVVSHTAAVALHIDGRHMAVAMFAPSQTQPARSQPSRVAKMHPLEMQAVPVHVHRLSLPHAPEVAAATQGSSAHLDAGVTEGTPFQLHTLTDPQVISVVNAAHLLSRHAAVAASHAHSTRRVQTLKSLAAHVVRRHRALEALHEQRSGEAVQSPAVVNSAQGVLRQKPLLVLVTVVQAQAMAPLAVGVQ